MGLILMPQITKIEKDEVEKDSEEAAKDSEEAAKDSIDNIETIQIKESIFYKIEKIGQGGFGKVYLFETKEQEPKQVAIKFFTKNSNVERELLNWNQLGYTAFQLHLPNLIQPILVMPFLGKTNMLDYIKSIIISESSNHILEEFKKIIIAGLTELEFFYSKQMIHTDAYMDNMLYQPILEKASLIDFDKILSQKELEEFSITDIHQFFSNIAMLQELLELMENKLPQLDFIMAKKNELTSEKITFENKGKLLTSLKEEVNKLSYTQKNTLKSNLFQPKKSAKLSEFDSSEPKKGKGCKLM